MEFIVKHNNKLFSTVYLGQKPNYADSAARFHPTSRDKVGKKRDKWELFE